jgi:serine/threonine protein kinase
MYKCSSPGGVEARVKIVHLQSTERHPTPRPMQEICIIRIAQSPNSIELLDVYLHNTHLWIIMEAPNRGPLNKLIEKHRFTEPQMAYITSEVSGRVL